MVRFDLLDGRDRKGRMTNTGVVCSALLFCGWGRCSCHEGDGKEEDGNGEFHDSGFAECEVSEVKRFEVKSFLS